jgi:RNA polymerase sigma-70 factor (ECF subfamily)
VVVSVRDLDSDASLVVSAQEGDSEAFAELFRRHYEPVRRSCVRRLSNFREADEVAQAAFVRAWERIGLCGGERRFGAWVRVIAHNLCIDTIRERTRTTPTDSPTNGVDEAMSEPPEDALLRSEAADLVQLALADLPPRQRQVVVARHLEDRRPGEIAAALGLSVGAVDSLLLRGRRRLAAAVERLSSDRGAITTSSASSAAAVGGTTRLAEIAESVANTVTRVSHGIASSMGMIPGVPGPAARLTAATVMAGAVAFGATSSSPPAHTNPPLAAAPIGVPSLPAAPVVSAPTTGTPRPRVVPLPIPGAAQGVPQAPVPVPEVPQVAPPVKAPVVQTLLQHVAGLTARVQSLVTR